MINLVTENILHDKPELIAKGFRKAGIVPWNPLAPTTDRMTPSMVYAQPEEQMLVQDQPQHQAEEVREKGGRKGQECADSDQEGLLDMVVKESEPDIESSSVPLQCADSRFLSRYELLLSKEETRFCQEKWAGGESLDHPVYKAWEALKQGSLTTEELQSQQEKLVQNKQKELKEGQEKKKHQEREVCRALEEQAGTEVLAEHTPKNIEIVKRKGGAKMPEGVDRFLPTSASHSVRTFALE